MIHQDVDCLCLSYSKFIEYLRCVSTCFHYTWEVSSHISLNLFFCSFPTFLLVPLLKGMLVFHISLKIYFSSFFSLLHRLPNLYQAIFNFAGSFARSNLPLSLFIECFSLVNFWTVICIWFFFYFSLLIFSI